MSTKPDVVGFRGKCLESQSPILLAFGEKKNHMHVEGSLEMGVRQIHTVNNTSCVLMCFALVLFFLMTNNRFWLPKVPEHIYDNNLHRAMLICCCSLLLSKLTDVVF